jgi:hypothetical protein
MMHVGMLWFDNDTKSGLDNRVERAAQYYQRKYGQTPNMCFVHPSMLASSAPDNGAVLNAHGVQVKPLSTVLPNHFWIGINRET